MSLASSYSSSSSSPNMLDTAGVLHIAAKAGTEDGGKVVHRWLLPLSGRNAEC